jgi:uncharacterized protein YggE
MKSLNLLRRVPLSICLVLIATSWATADDKPEPRLITVTGEAEIKVAPDEVVFDVTVLTFNRDLRLAKSQTDDRIKRLLELTRKYKIAEQDVQTDYIKLDPRFKGNDEARVLLGYSVRKDLVFTLRDASQAEGLLSELMESGISRINGIRFQTSQLRKYRDQARAMAVKAAKEKATALASEIAQQIGKAYSIVEEVPGRVPVYQNFSANNSVSFSADKDSADSESTLELGLIKVNAKVTVRFELN